MYLSLNPDKILDSNQKLVARIDSLFPQSGLKKVCLELLDIAIKSKQTADWITRPHVPLRLAVGILILGILSVSVWSLMIAQPEIKKVALTEFVQTIEAFMNIAIFSGIALLFLFTAETRIKRRRALTAIHELRALAHVIDMHQVTKDPEIVLVDPEKTPSAPTETMTRFELLRYLDFCCDMLSLIAKLAALYIQKFDDPIVLSSVNDVESLTTGLATKIWHKMQTVYAYKC